MYEIMYIESMLASGNLSGSLVPVEVVSNVNEKANCQFVQAHQRIRDVLKYVCGVERYVYTQS